MKGAGFGGRDMLSRSAKNGGGKPKVKPLAEVPNNLHRSVFQIMEYF